MYVVTSVKIFLKIMCNENKEMKISYNICIIQFSFMKVKKSDTEIKVRIKI